MLVEMQSPAHHWWKMKAVLYPHKRPASNLAWNKKNHFHWVRKHTTHATVTREKCLLIALPSKRYTSTCTQRKHKKMSI